jgi:mono/diheme cytochrome c family protein
MRALTSRTPAALALTLLAGLAATGAGGQAASPLLAGAFNEEQAVRGQALYYERCLSCHGEEMMGLDQAPPLAGPRFASVWEGASLQSLVERIETPCRRRRPAACRGPRRWTC